MDNELNLDNLVKETLDKIDQAVSHPLPDRDYIERLENYATTLIGQYVQQDHNQVEAAKWSQG